MNSTYYVCITNPSKSNQSIIVPGNLLTTTLFSIPRIIIASLNSIYRLHRILLNDFPFSNAY